MVQTQVGPWGLFGGVAAGAEPIDVNFFFGGLLFFFCCGEEELFDLGSQVAWGAFVRNDFPPGISGLHLPLQFETR